MKEKIAAFVKGVGDFDQLALELFAQQRAANPVYARIAGDARPRGPVEIPAVPVSLFKDLDLCPFPDAPICFLTSGTTEGRRGAHRMRDTTLYDLGATRQMRGFPKRVVSLVSRDDASSLDHMVRLVGSPDYCMDEAGMHADAWSRILSSPCFLASTAFAMDALLARQEGSASEPEANAGRLTTGTLVMVTGGFKGRVHRLDSDTLYRSLGARVPGAQVRGEYGMTELSSQLWTAPVAAGEIPGAFRLPPWMRAWAVDPASGAAIDGVGALRFLDLANVDSVCAIETQDVGTVCGEWVTLTGRLAGAEARGCSLRAEQLLARAQ